MTNDLEKNNNCVNRPQSAGMNRTSNNVLESWRRQSALVERFQ